MDSRRVDQRKKPSGITGYYLVSLWQLLCRYLRSCTCWRADRQRWYQPRCRSDLGHYFRDHRPEFARLFKRFSERRRKRPVDRTYVISQWIPLLVSWHVDLDCSNHHTHLVDWPSILALSDGRLSSRLITVALRYRGSDGDGYSVVLLPTRYLIWHRRRSKTTFDDCVSRQTRWPNKLWRKPLGWRGKPSSP